MRRVGFVTATAVAVALVFAAGVGTASAADPLYRVNAGGSAVATAPLAWSGDSVLMPSPYSNSAATKNKVSSNAAAIDTSDPSVPPGTPASLFQDARWDPTGNKEMQWDFPVAAGSYEVRLYFVEDYAPNFAVGRRVFDVAIEGQTVLQNFDIYAAAGAGNKGIVRSFTVSADANVDIDFTHGATENPVVSAIEITPVSGPSPAVLSASPASAAAGSVAVGQTKVTPVTLTNTASSGGQSLTISGASISGADATSFSSSFTSATPITLAPGQSTTANVTFAPLTPGARSATLSIAASAAGSPLTIPLSGTGTSASSPGIHVNAGGPALTAGGTSWLEDSVASPSVYTNSAATKNKVSSTTAAIDTSDPSVPAGTPASLFQTERYDPTGGKEMQWSFPTTAGASYTVRLYFAETYTGTQAVGARTFDMSIDGVLKLDDFDIYAAAGANRGIVRSFTITSDGTTNIDFAHVTENPAVNAVEVIPAGSTPPTATLTAAPSSVSFASTATGATRTQQLVLTAAGAPVRISGTTINGAAAGDFTDSFDDTQATTLAAGQTLTLNVSFHPVTSGTKSASLVIAHDAAGSPLTIPLSGTATTSGGGTTTIGFGKSLLQGESSSAPTSLEFGPDGRLYVAQFNGNIYAYTIARTSPNHYSVTNAELINNLRSIPNHDDDGSLNPSVTTRLVTGIAVAGTAASPVIYATSSDPRIGTYGDGTIINIDTNSSMISKLSKQGAGWVKQDLVRGLPRSKENHSPNGLIYDAASNRLYVTVSSNTNEGSPSNSFAQMPEYAMGTGILAVDLTAIGSTTYDLPTLDDETRPGVNDANDPFGGDGGKNQARLPTSGPVSFYATGLRNPYDIVKGINGLMYTIDNGGNAGWGGPPVNEGPQGACTNAESSPGETEPDKLFIVHQGDYFGHPNPTRGNRANTFNPTNPQSPVATADPRECDFLTPAEAGALTTFTDSTNGFAQYTATNFAGALRGDLIAPLYNGNSINRIDLNAAGTAAVSNTTLFNTVGQRPLDIATQDDSGAFRGDLFVADLAIDGIVVYEPNDFDGAQSTCTGADDPVLDEDNDGYTNADEIDNGTNPCSSADAPADHDQDGVSDLNDADDDDDGVADADDAFAIDAQNGLENTLPLALTFDNDQVAGGLLGLNWTGLMTNGTTNWLTQFDETKMTAGGAGGLMTVDEVPEGDARGAANTQQYAFQAGVNVAPATTNQFTAQGRIIAPFFGGGTPQANASQGFYIGNGGQDDYIKVVISANGGAGGVEVVREVGGTVTTDVTSTVSLGGKDRFDLYLTVDPDAGTAQASYRPTTGGVAGTRVNVGPVLSVPSSWLAGTAKGLALGAIATSAGPSPVFAANWDFVRAVAGDGSDM